jgi:hypothetical protein
MWYVRLNPVRHAFVIKNAEKKNCSEGVLVNGSTVNFVYAVAIDDAGKLETFTCCEYLGVIKYIRYKTSFEDHHFWGEPITEKQFKQECPNVYG